MAMKLLNDRNFPVAALLVAIILLSVLMTYSIATRQNPEGFSIVYFVPGSLESGSPRYVIENHRVGLDGFELHPLNLYPAF